MRDQVIDMWETLFIVLSLFATVITAMQPYFIWLIGLALGVQLFDFASTPDHTIDFVVLLLLVLAVLPTFNILSVIAPYITWLLVFALAFQLYDDYSS